MSIPNQHGIVTAKNPQMKDKMTLKLLMLKAMIYNVVNNVILVSIRQIIVQNVPTKEQAHHNVNVNLVCSKILQELVQNVQNNVLHVQDILLTVQSVMELEKEPQNVFVQMVIMNMMLSVKNVILTVLHVAVTGIV